VTSPAPLELGDALEALVGQFSDPWSFLRELVQNAIDAGSLEIDVSMEFDPKQGVMTIELIDNGEGMDREIIDTRLTRLFSSAKDGDYTKIGRFGIGFVSVFAIEPDVVCVDTARAGEHWRILFHKDRSFERILLDAPGEGTTVRIFRKVDEAEFTKSRERALATLRYWCRHAHVDIRFDGSSISEALTVDSPCVASFEEEGTAVVVGIWTEADAPRGYYHGGLTLHEEVGGEGGVPHVAFKIDSRFLEHTLTRDNVLRDENYAKAMAIVARVASEELIDEVFRQLAEQAALEADVRDSALVGDLCAALLRHLAAGGKVPRERREAPLIPTLGGPPISLAACAAQGSDLRCDRVRSPVTDLLLSAGKRVLDCSVGDPIHALVKEAAGAEASSANAELCFASAAPSATEDLRWHALANAVRGLLVADGVKLSGIAIGDLRYPGSPVADRIAITQGELGELTPIEEAGELGSGIFHSGRYVVLNAGHEVLRSLLDGGGAATEPELSAYLIIKLIYLREELNPERDGRLVARALEGRCRRLTGS